MNAVKPTLKPCCLAPVGLRCEYRENPVGMDEMSPEVVGIVKRRKESYGLSD